MQGGDGGMEYPMSTLIINSGPGLAFHEWMHSWYQGMLGTNESMYAWMDEGFADYYSQVVNRYYRDFVTKKTAEKNNDVQGLKYIDSIDNVLPYDHSGSYRSYFALVKSGMEEPPDDTC